MTLTNAVVAFTIYFCIAYGCGALMARKGRNCVVGFLLAFCIPVLGVIWVVFSAPAGSVRSRASSEYSPGADARAHPTDGGSAAAAPEMLTCSFCRMKVPPNADVCRVCQTPLRSQGNAAEVAA